MELQELKWEILEHISDSDFSYDIECVDLKNVGGYSEIQIKKISDVWEWRDEGKYSYRDDIFRAFNGDEALDVYIRVSRSRCGSYFSHYEEFIDSIELVEPGEEVEVVQKWVKSGKEVKQEKTMDLQILAQSIPVIKFNKEGLKLALKEHLEKYGNLVVTPETEKDCKKVKSELGKLEKSIEDFRKNTKKAISEPIAKFEEDCKELVALIHEVKKPIDTQLKEIEDVRKAEKEALIREEIAKIVTEYSLDEKHSSQIDIKATWLNKTTSMNKVTTELKNLAETLKIAQMSVQKNIGLIRSTCELHNARLKKPLDVIGWIELLDKGEEIQTIVEKIHAEGKRRLSEEIEEEEKEAREILNQPEEEPVVHEEPIQSIYTPRYDEPIMSATIKLYGTQEQFKAFKNIMASIGMRYDIVK